MTKPLHLSVKHEGQCLICGSETQANNSVQTLSRFEDLLESGEWRPCCVLPFDVLVIHDSKLRKLLAECVNVLDTKGADYTAGNMSTDRLHNFRTVAEETGVSMYQVWYVYFYKHLSSVKKFVKDGRVESEPLESRVVDLINYLYLLLCIRDDQAKVPENMQGR